MLQIQSPPSKLKYSRNGGLLIYDGKLDNAMSLLKWLTDLENLKIDGRIEEVMTRHGKACKHARQNSILYLLYLN